MDEIYQKCPHGLGEQLSQGTTEDFYRVYLAIKDYFDVPTHSIVLYQQMYDLFLRMHFSMDLDDTSYKDSEEYKTLYSKATTHFGKLYYLVDNFVEQFDDLIHVYRPSIDLIHPTEDDLRVWKYMVEDYFTRLKASYEERGIRLK